MSASAPASVKLAGRSPLAQLLHALNQPLTGLQCSMEVALISPRTPEQYVRSLRENLELTERMRALVGAIREVTDMEEAKNEEEKSQEPSAGLAAMVQAAVEDLAPVAEVRNVRLELNFNRAASHPFAMRKARTLRTCVFRLLESALGAAASRSAVRVETDGEGGGPESPPWMRIRWQAGGPASVFWRSEVGLLVAQAGFLQAGAAWQRERSDESETVTIRLAGTAGTHRHF